MCIEKSLLNVIDCFKRNVKVITFCPKKKRSIIGKSLMNKFYPLLSLQFCLVSLLNTNQFELHQILWVLPSFQLTLKSY